MFHCFHHGYNPTYRVEHYRADSVCSDSYSWTFVLQFVESLLSLLLFRSDLEVASCAVATAGFCEEVLKELVPSLFTYQLLELLGRSIELVLLISAIVFHDPVFYQQ